MKKAQATNTMILWIILVVVIVLVVWFIYPFFRDKVYPWVNNLWGGGSSVGGGSSQSGGSSGGGVAISPVTNIPGLKPGENPCPIEIGYLEDLWQRRPGTTYYRKIYLNYDSAQARFFYPSSLNKLDILFYMHGTTILWIGDGKFDPEYIHLGKIDKSNGRISRLLMPSYFPILFEKYSNVFFDYSYFSKSDLEDLKKLDGAYINPVDLNKLGESKTKKINICITKEIQQIQEERAKEQEIGYVHYFISEPDKKWIVLALGTGNFNTDDSHIFWTNIMIKGNQLFLYANGATGKDTDNAVRVGKIGGYVGDLIIDPTFLVSNLSSESKYRNFLNIENTNENHKSCSEFGIDKSNGYCRYSEIVYILKQLNGALITYRGISFNIPGDKNDVIESLIVKRTD